MAKRPRCQREVVHAVTGWPIGMACVSLQVDDAHHETMRRERRINVTETISRLKDGMEDHEGRVAKALENHTAKLPSDLWLWAAVASMGASLLLQVANKKDGSRFVGQWAAPLLLVGVYNKIVKVAGSDRGSAAP
jgi:isopentenyl diphosphate isomerase/L-lactate dehydrogenase-like FMN-dependent dehydrogenase